MPRPRKIPVTDAPAASGFAAMVEDFKARFPDRWEALRLCPLQHGLEAMTEALKD